MKKIVLLFTLIVTMFTAQARKFYVSQSGNDTYTTTQAQNPVTPWATMSKVQSNLGSFSSGDSILFAKGSKFSGTLTIQSKTGLYFGVYGTGADPLFWGNGGTISQLVTLRGCTNVTFYGWRISDTTISFTDRTVQARIQTVFKIEQSSTCTVIRRCTMDRIGYGAYITSSSRGQTMDSNDIGNLRMIRNTPTSVNPDDDYGGVPVQISSRDNTFTNNYLHDCWSQSYDYGNDGGGVEFFEEGDTIKGNRIMYNTFYDCNGTFEFGSSPNGVAGNPQVDNIIAYNKIINSSSLTYINNSGQYRTIVRNLQFYNNVIVQTIPSRNGTLRMISMATPDPTSKIVVLKNNIFQVSNGAAVARSGTWTGSSLIHTNNIYKLSNGSITNFTLDATELATSGIIWTNTSNTNPLNWDYTLTSTSPAINTGVDVGLIRDFAGNPIYQTPDIGIYEKYGTVSISPCLFTYGPWSVCNNGYQTRSYSINQPNCQGVPSRDSIRRTCINPTIISFYYNSDRRAIWINTTRPGSMAITNALGSIIRNVNYSVGGQWINMNRQAAGIYFASTFGQGLTFMR